MKTIERLSLSAQQDQWPAWRLTNDSGASVTIMSWGASILEISVPDHKGVLNDVALGFDQLQDYKINAPKLGCIVGPYANRIHAGRFPLNGKIIQLECNSNGHHLHGGENGLHAQQWSLIAAENDANHSQIELHCRLDKKASGYSASYDIFVVYAWNNQCELSIQYRARSSHDTVINLTQHSYFNLAGVESIESIEDHQLWINSSEICELDESLIPTGRIQSTSKTALDFSRLTELSTRLRANDSQINRVNGLDYNWVFNNDKTTIKLQAALYDPHSLRHLRVFSDQPGLQVYSGNFLDNEAGKYQQHYAPHSGLCLETQHFPDSPNHLNFPSTSLRQGEEFKSRSVYQFGLESPNLDAEFNPPTLY
ncbi:MAG: aldose epimerase family protein [Cellvibrionaceae bacterium]